MRCAHCFKCVLTKIIFLYTGLLLYGPPGCAKTSLVCAIANATNTTFLAVSAAELYSSYVGEAERNVADLFQKARMNSPCILFIDEIGNHRK